MPVVINGTTGIVNPDGSASTPSLAGTDTNTGMFFPAADTVAVATGGSERVRVDSSGNVGVGTSSPTNNLQVEGKASAYAVALVKSNGGAGNGYGASFQLTNTNGDNYQIRIADSGSGSTYQQALDFLTISAPSGKGLRFSTNGAESARIDSSGNLLVGTTSVLSPGSVSGVGNIVNTSTTNGAWALALQNNGTAANSGRGLGIRNVTDFNTSSNEFIYCVGGTSSVKFVVMSNGGIYNFSANNVNLSDRREKTNFAPAGEYLSKICAVPVQTFNYIDQNLEDDPGTTLGVVAQDLMEVAPELVTEKDVGTPDEPKPRLTIYQTDLQYALMKCIQELNAKVESLTAEIATLKGAQA